MGTSFCQTKCLWKVIHCEFTEGIDLDLLVFYRLCQLFCFHCDKGILLLHTGCEGTCCEGKIERMNTDSSFHNLNPA